MTTVCFRGSTHQDIITDCFMMWYTNLHCNKTLKLERSPKMQQSTFVMYAEGTCLLVFFNHFKQHATTRTFHICLPARQPTRWTQISYHMYHGLYCELCFIISLIILKHCIYSCKHGAAPISKNFNISIKLVSCGHTYCRKIA